MLHEARHGVDDDVYASTNLSVPIPKYRIPADAQLPRNAYQLIADELMLDGNSRQNLATFCQTWAEPEVRCVSMLADLWHSPDAVSTVGTSTTGSSEAAMLGGLALQRQWRRRQQAAGQPADRPNLVTGPVQICWHKFTRYWDIELREIPMDGDRLIMTPDEVLKRVDENTIGVVPTLGVTFTGQYEPVKAVSEALDQLQADKGLDVPIHVDAASGGFLAPFCDPDLLWDFRLPRVK